MVKSQAIENLMRALLGTRMITHVHLKVARGLMVGAFLTAHFQIQEDDIGEHGDSLNRRWYRSLSPEQGQR